MIDLALKHITEVAATPSFSTYEERLHPYIKKIFKGIDSTEEIAVKGNNQIYKLEDNSQAPTIAITSHLDKINHYGEEFPSQLPVTIKNNQIEGAMDDSAGVGMALSIAERFNERNWPNLLFFFSEMEEKKGLKEHPELMKNNGIGYENGMGARRISQRCIGLDIIPEQVITLDTTPLFKGKPGVALYAKHWELTDLNPSPELVEKTEYTVENFLKIDSAIKVDNNTNDYLHYGREFNQENNTTVSVALEPSIFPYHQKGERVYIDDIHRCLSILKNYLDSVGS